MKKIFVGLILSLFLVGCTNKKSHEPTGTPDISLNAGVGVVSGSGDFGQLGPKDSKILTLLITNSGDAPLQGPPQLDNTTDFSILYQSGCASILPKKSCTIKLNFSAVGKLYQEYSANLALDSVLVALSAEVVDPNPTQTSSISFSVASLDFGTITDKQSVVKSVVITNTGSSKISGSTINIPGEPTPKSFTLAYDNCSNKDILPGKTCLVKVAFKGSEEIGVLSTSLSFVGQSLPLSGTVVSSSGSSSLGSPNVQFLINNQISSSYDFGSLSGTQAQQVIIVAKNNGTKASGVSSAALGSSNFSIVFNQCVNKSLAPGSSCQVRVLFSASGKTPNTYTDSLSFAGQSVALSSLIPALNILDFEPYLLSSSSNLEINDKNIIFSWGGYRYQNKRLFFGNDSSYNQNQLFLVDTTNNEIKSMTLSGYGGGDIFNFSNRFWENNGVLLLNGWNTYQTIVLDFKKPIIQDPNFSNYDCTLGYNPCYLSNGMFSNLLFLRTLYNEGTKIIGLNYSTQQNLDASSVFIYDTALPISATGSVQNSAGNNNLYPPIYQECSQGGNPCYVKLPSGSLIKDSEFNKPLISGGYIYTAAQNCVSPKVILGPGSYHNSSVGCNGIFELFRISLSDFSINNMGPFANASQTRFFNLDDQLFAFVSPSSYLVESIEPLTSSSSPLLIPGLSIAYNYFNIQSDCYHALCNNQAISGNGVSIFPAMDGSNPVIISKQSGTYTSMNFNTLIGSSYVEDVRVLGSKIFLMSGVEGRTGSGIRGFGSIWMYNTLIPYSVTSNPLCGQGSNPCVLGQSQNEILVADLKNLIQDTDGSLLINGRITNSTRYSNQAYKFNSLGEFVKVYKLEKDESMVDRKVCIIYFEEVSNPNSFWADTINEEVYPINSQADCQDAIEIGYWGGDPLDSGYRYSYLYQESVNAKEQFSADFINIQGSKLVSLGYTEEYLLGQKTFQIDRGSGLESVIVDLEEQEVSLWYNITPMSGRQTNK